MTCNFRAHAAASAATIALLISGVCLAQAEKEKDKPTSKLGKIMKKIDEETKAIQKASSTRTTFKKADAKKLKKSVEELVKLGKDTRDFKKPAEDMKQPYDKWLDMTARYIAAAEEVGKQVEAKNFPNMAKARATLIQTCSNCHGAFRPEVDDGF